MSLYKTHQLLFLYENSVFKDDSNLYYSNLGVINKIVTLIFRLAVRLFFKKTPQI